MKCIRVTAPKEPLVFLDNEPIPEAPDNGAVVKISYGGMCHSDVHFWNGDENVGGGKGLPLFKYPCIPGHEIAGVLFSLGDSATKNNESGLKPGDRVVVYPWIHCHACGSCKAGHGEFCKDETLLRLTSIGLRRDGGFAQFVAVPDVLFVVPVPAPIPLPVACLLPCSGVTAYHAVEEGVEFVKNVTEITGGCSVLTIGAGGVGQWGIRLARAMYPPETQIMCAEIKKEALDEVAGRVRGVEPFLMGRDQPSDSIAQQVKAASRTAKGVNLVLDFVGVTKTFEIAQKSLDLNGQYLATGLLGGEAQFPLAKLVLRGITMKGIIIGSLVQLKRLVELVLKMPFIYDNLTYSVHSLDDGIQIMEKLAKGQVVGRAILKCNDDDE